MAFNLIERRLLAFAPDFVVVKIRTQIRLLDQDAEMIGGFHHGALNQLDFRPLQRGLEHAARGLDLFASSPQLTQEYGEIEQTRHDEQERARDSQDARQCLEVHLRVVTKAAANVNRCCRATPRTA